MTDRLRPFIFDRPSIPEATRVLESYSRIADLNPILGRLALISSVYLDEPPATLFRRQRQQALIPFQPALREIRTRMVTLNTLVPKKIAPEVDLNYVDKEDDNSQTLRSLFRTENYGLRLRFRKQFDDYAEERSDKIKAKIKEVNQNQAIPVYNVVIIGDGPIGNQVAEFISPFFSNSIILTNGNQVAEVWDRNLAVNNSVDVKKPGGINWPFQGGSTGPIGIPGIATIGLSDALLFQDTYTVICDDNLNTKTYIKGPEVRDVLKFRAVQHGIPIVLDANVDIPNITDGPDNTSELTFTDNLTGQEYKVRARTVFIATGGGSEVCKLTDERSKKDFEQAHNLVFSQIRDIQKRHKMRVGRIKELSDADSNFEVSQLVELIKEKRQTYLAEMSFRKIPNPQSRTPQRPAIINNINARIDTLIKPTAEITAQERVKIRQEIETIVNQMEREQITLPPLLSRTILDAAISCWKRYMDFDPARFPLNQIRESTKSIGFGGKSDTFLTTLALLLETEDVPAEAKPAGVPKLDLDQVTVCSRGLPLSPLEYRQSLRPRYREILQAVRLLNVIPRNIVTCEFATQAREDAAVAQKLGIDPELLLQIRTIDEIEDDNKPFGVNVQLEGIKDAQFFSYFFQNLGLTRKPYEDLLNLAPVTVDVGREEVTVAYGNEQKQRYLLGTASGITDFPTDVNNALDFLNIAPNTQALWVWAGTINPYFIIDWVTTQILDDILFSSGPRRIKI